MPFRPSQQGYTLIELSVVLIILCAIGGMATTYLGGATRQSECTATDVSMSRVRDVIAGNAVTPGFFGDMNRMPYSLFELLMCLNDSRADARMAPADYNCPRYGSARNSGWNGPYLTTAQPRRLAAADSTGTGGFNDATILDSFRPANGNRDMANGVVDPACTAAGCPLELMLAQDAGSTECHFFLLSRGPNNKGDVLEHERSQVGDTAVSSASLRLACRNLGSQMLSVIQAVPAVVYGLGAYAGSGVSPRMQVVNWNTLVSGRGDDRILMLDGPAPGENPSCK